MAKRLAPSRAALLALLLACRYTPCPALRLDDKEEGLLGLGISASPTVAPNSHEPRCSSLVVHETCVFLRQGDADPSKNASLFDALIDLLAAKRPHVEELWGKLHLSAGADCAALCAAVLAGLQIEGKTLPPSSDMGCYTTGSNQVSCDLDLSPYRLVEVQQEVVDIPGLNSQIYEPEAAPLAGDSEYYQPWSEEAKEPPTRIEYSSVDLLVRIANLFRIYPLTAVGVRKGITKGGAAAPMAIEVTKRAMMAQAFVNHAIRRFKLSRTKQLMMKWFGKVTWDDKHARHELLRVLNGIDQVLKNSFVIYSNSGTDLECNKTNSYVHQFGPKSRTHEYEGGQRKIFLCPPFFKSPVGLQVLTLVRAASQHEPALTVDVCMDSISPRSDSQMYATLSLSELPEQLTVDSVVDVFEANQIAPAKVLRIDEDGKALLELYPPTVCRGKANDRSRHANGRSICSGLATVSPEKAGRNSDNYCYFVSSVIDDTAGVSVEVSVKGQP